MKLTRLTATVIAAATVIMPFSSSTPVLPVTSSVLAGDAAFDEESFFVYVGTYSGGIAQFRYLYPESDDSYNADKVLWKDAPSNIAYGDVFVAEGKATMTQVYPAKADPINAHAYYYTLDEGSELEKAGNCSDIMDKKDLKVTSKTYDGSAHWSVRYADAAGETYYYGLSTYGSNLIVDPLDCEVGDVYTYALYNDYMVVPLEKKDETSGVTKYTPSGDVNNDGKLTVSDVVLFQRWLLNVYDSKLLDWKAADYCNDNKLDFFDLCIMKRELLKNTVLEYVEPDERYDFGVTATVAIDGLELHRGPDDSYETLDSIPANVHIVEYGSQIGNSIWMFTEYDGKYGWIRTMDDEGKTPYVHYEMMAKKPVIYLYPEQETDVHIDLELTESEFYTSYPKYDNGWNVVAYPDGKILNKADGSYHRYLFWEADNCRTKFDFSKGFCVSGSDTESFLKEKLTYMGLTKEEMNEFIVYWLPEMEHNAYNLIAFQGDAYTNSAKLTVTPAPDSECRIFMAFVPLEDAVDIEPQQLETFERKGFTVVEWGGAEVR